MNQNPWHNIEQRYHRGRKLRGQITAVAAYGCCVELEPGVEGLVRVGDEGIANETFRVGSEIEVVVVEVDSKQHRIGLGLVHLPHA